MAATSVAEAPTDRSEAGWPDGAIRRLGLAVVVVSTVLFAWFAATGRATLLGSDVFGGFFDLQARAMMHGNLSLPAGSLGFEGFVVDGRTYTYFGIFPSLLRMPVLAVTDELDGRLTVLSMITAHVVGMWSTVLIVERVHSLLRPGGRWSRPGAVLAGAVLVAAGLGSNLLYAASRAWVYHEAGLWGAAAVLAAFAAIFDFLRNPRLRPVVAAGAWTAVAWLSRGSVGVAPSVVLGLLGVAHLTGLRFVQALVPRPRDDRGAPVAWPRRPRLGAALLLAAVAGGLAFGAVNTAKFGSPTALPFDEQVASRTPWPERTAAFDAYGGDLLSPTLIPVNVIQDLRPDLLSPSGLWPLVQYRDPEPVGLFDPVFDTVEPSAGLTLTVPGLLVLTAVAVVAAVRPRRGSRHGPPDDAAVLRPFLLGAALAGLASLSIAFISQRYLSDLIPLLVVGGAGGLAVVDRWAAGAAEPRQRRWVQLAVGGLVVVTAFGVVTNVAVTWLFQRVESPKDPAARVSGVRTRLAAHDLLGLDAPPTVRSATFLEDVQEGKLLIVGDCKAMYWGADNGRWFPMEVGRSAGHHRLAVRLEGALGDQPVPLLTVGSAEANVVIAVEALPGDGDRAHLIAVEDRRVTTEGSAAIDVDDLRDADLDVWLGGPGGTVDLGGISVSEGERFTGAERSLLFQIAPVPALTPSAAGRNPFDGTVASRFPGTVTQRAISMDTCRDLLAAR